MNRKRVVENKPPNHRSTQRRIRNAIHGHRQIDPGAESRRPPDPELLIEMGSTTKSSSKAGVLLALDGLHPSSKGARVKFSGKSRTVIDGPFTEAKELIAGFSILQVKSLEEAIEWVKRAPNCNPGGDSEVEIRQVSRWKTSHLSSPKSRSSTK